MGIKISFALDLPSSPQINKHLVERSATGMMQNTKGVIMSIVDRSMFCVNLLAKTWTVKFRQNR